MSGGSMDYVAWKIKEAARHIQREMRKDMPRVIDAKVILCNYADRIEKAYEFELAVEKAKAAGEGYAAGKQSVTDCNQPVTNCHALNAAKMREALESAKRFIEYLMNLAWFHECSFTATKNAMDAGNLIDEALAAPPRNCDRFATYNEAHREWFRDEVEPRLNDVSMDHEEIPFTEWLFAKAKGVANINLTVPSCDGE